eukprot:TRINITY_DN3687_c0_g3_i1.p1 TRINITY_DN3687_c0_g3~~TRINITY_DN3687_c0_g3_i1.p1  ORF type:complete len:491 (+),score=169.81 TRINITY_DN3687_c0_g3_i1:122-1594(+)
MMKVLALCVLLFFSFISAEDDVIVLDSNNFDSVLAENPLILVEFYAPWCGHCKHLEPEYAAAATELKGKVPLAKVDADAELNRPLGDRYGIQGFPTLKLFRNGVPSDYTGGRTSEEIISWCTRQSRPAVTEISSLADLQALIGSEELLAVAFFEDKADAHSAFSEQAQAGRESFTYASVINNADIAKEYGVTKFPATLYFRKFSQEPLRFQNHWIELNKFLGGNSLPIISEIGPQNFKKFAEAGRPLAYVFIDLTVEGQLEDVLAKVTPVATSSQDSLVWCYIDFAKYAKHSERLGLSGTTVPSVAIDNMETGFHYTYDEKEEVNQANLQAWVDKFIAGDVKPTLKSEEIPADNTGPVKVIVGKSYDDIVLDTTKDVLVEFYAPWCGHCKHLAPIYEEVGQHFQSNDKVVIAKIDATANDVNPNLNIRGFPTIKLFKASDKSKPIDYDLERTKEAIIQFIEDHSSFKEAAPAATPVESTTTNTANKKDEL